MQQQGSVKSSSNPAFHVKLAQSRNSSAVVERDTRYILKCCFGGTATMCLLAQLVFSRTVGVPFFARAEQGAGLFFFFFLTTVWGFASWRSTLFRVTLVRSFPQFARAHPRVQGPIAAVHVCFLSTFLFFVPHFFPKLFASS